MAEAGKSAAGVSEKRCRDERGRYLPNHGEPGPGRPKGITLREALDDAIDNRELAAKLAQLARREGKGIPWTVVLQAIEYAMDRKEGKPKQSSDVNLTGDMTVKLDLGEA